MNASPSIDVFPEIMYDRVHVAPTSGRARGLELSLSQDGGEHVDWAASYALASATERTA